jgi:putative transposase
MSRAMNEKDLEQLKAHVTQLAKGLKSQAELGDLTQQLMKMTVEAALGAELDEHYPQATQGPAWRG